MVLLTKMKPIAFLIASCLVLATGCWAATPRIEDAQAPRDFYAEINPSASTCDREVLVFPAGAAPGRPFKELASLSATCSPGSIALCERRMKDRACELGADAVVLVDTEPGPNPATPARQRLTSRSGRAIRWEP